MKAPQYFAPGVAGDHGEPIAQYIQIGDFLFPNNLPANAHGNGYADPNLLIPTAIGSVETDAGAFDVRHGNNAVNLAVAYGLRPRLEPFLAIGGDMHNYDLSAGWSPANPQTGAWVGLEIVAAMGSWHFQKIASNTNSTQRDHSRSDIISWLYSGRAITVIPACRAWCRSRVPVPGDTIDPRQSDRTYTSLFVASDTWQISDRRQAQFSGYFRSYGLSLQSNFGDGLIRQSESRTVAGGNASYTQRISDRIWFSAGLDLRQDAPRNAELARSIPMAFSKR